MTDADQLDWDDLLVMQGNTIRYSRDWGQTWTYGLIASRPTTNGVTVWLEVRDGIHGKAVLRASDLLNAAFLVEGARGVSGKEWSYKGTLW